MSKRVLKVNELIKKELGQIILREFNFGKGILTTITRVETSPNLIQSKVFISVIPTNKKNIVLKELKKVIYFLQEKLNHRLIMRPVPKIIFVEEKETERAAKIEKILEELKKEKK